jgi:hypothetical protein
MLRNALYESISQHRKNSHSSIQLAEAVGGLPSFRVYPKPQILEGVTL